MDVPEKGKGVVTLVSVEKDDLICEYCGELMTHKRERRELFEKKFQFIRRLHVLLQVSGQQVLVCGKYICKLT